MTVFLLKLSQFKSGAVTCNKGKWHVVYRSDQWCFHTDQGLLCHCDAMKRPPACIVLKKKSSVLGVLKLRFLTLKDKTQEAERLRINKKKRLKKKYLKAFPLSSLLAKIIMELSVESFITVMFPQ